MVADQRPVVHTEPCVGQVQIVFGVGRQGFEMSAEVVAQVADQAACEGQLHRSRQYSSPQLRQMNAQALQEIGTALVRQYRQMFQWPGTEQIIAPAFGARPAAVDRTSTRLNSSH